MSNKLSHSQIQKFQFCNHAWKHHYINRWRPIGQQSYFVLGNAIDKTIEIILKKEQGQLSNKEVFDYHFTFQYLNDILTNIAECKDIVYSAKDLDEELLTSEDMNSGLNMSWLSLRNKGRLMIEAFEKEVLPLITKVYSTQEKVELINEEGDSNIGYADCIVDMVGCSSPIVLDFKTSAFPYKEDSVRMSTQLAGYMHVLSSKYNTRLAGYVVFGKNINKNRIKVCVSCGHTATGSHRTCNNMIEIDGGHVGVNDVRCGGEWSVNINPTCNVQIIIDKIPELLEDMVVENIEAVNKAIHAGIFTRNLSGCLDNGYGKKCEYFSICYEENTTGFYKKEETND